MKPYLSDLNIINLELCVGVRLMGVEDLFDSYWTESVFAIGLLQSVSLWCIISLYSELCLTLLGSRSESLP